MMGAGFPILLDITGGNEITVHRGMNFLSENADLNRSDAIKNGIIL